MPPNPQSKTYSIINGLAIAGPFSYLLSPTLTPFYLTLLNSSVANHSLPAHYKGVILLLVKGANLVLNNCYQSVCPIAAATPRQIITSPRSLGAPHDDSLMDKIEIPQPGSTVAMKFNQSVNRYIRCNMYGQLTLLLFLGGVPAGGGGQEDEERDNSPVASIQSRKELPVHHKWTSSACGTSFKGGIKDILNHIKINAIKPGSTVVMSFNQGNTDLNGVFLNRRLTLLLF